MWVKSSYSNPSGCCLEWQRPGPDPVVRDSVLGEESPVLRLSPRAWQEMTGKIKRGWQPQARLTA